MDKEIRDMAWNVVERQLAGERLPLGTAMPAAILIEVRNDDVIANVEAELRRAGIEVVNVAQKRWWLFGKRWEIEGRAPKVPMSRAETDAWVDRIEASIAQYGAKVLLWVPLNPELNER
ncbi:MAG TPA: hypothetical protein VK571_00775 [Gemmatimonadaceae bacterium]|nr:hypothetical protein [Gemmatimonadaceae bacterium]